MINPSQLRFLIDCLALMIELPEVYIEDRDDGEDEYGGS